MNNNAIIIENSILKKTLNISGNKIVSSEILNKISGLTLKSGEGSEEFILRFKKGFLSNKEIKASELKVIDTDKNMTDKGEVYTVTFKPFKVFDSKLNLKLVYTLKDEKSVIRKHIELSYDKRGKKSIILDYIDFESMRFDSALNSWSIPKQANSHVPGYALEIGQPLYVDSLFFGVEFPAALNKIEESKTSLRYYSGKNLTDIMKNNLFISYEAVMGAADGNAFPQVQRAFFEYKIGRAHV